MNFEAVAKAHATELNKSINNSLNTVATNLLIGLSIIALSIYMKK